MMKICCFIWKFQMKLLVVDSKSSIGKLDEEPSGLSSLLMPPPTPIVLLDTLASHSPMSLLHGLYKYHVYSKKYRNKDIKQWQCSYEFLMVQLPLHNIIFLTYPIYHIKTQEEKWKEHQKQYVQFCMRYVFFLPLPSSTANLLYPSFL